VLRAAYPCPLSFQDQILHIFEALPALKLSVLAVAAIYVICYFFLPVLSWLKREGEVKRVCVSYQRNLRSPLCREAIARVRSLALGVFFSPNEYPQSVF